jgi:RNA polymerase sigma-70 factor (ECF subfamily)
VAVAADRSEASLVERIVAGDDRALATVYDRYGGTVYSLAARMVGRANAVDICQEVFVALWDHPERFDPSRSDLRGFLVTIGRRRCIDHLRRLGRRSATEQRSVQARPSADPSVDDAAIAHLTGDGVRRALTLLPEPQRRAIELAYFDGLTFRQVAAVTNTSEGTAKSRIRLGLQRLATELRPHEEVGTT